VQSAGGAVSCIEWKKAADADAYEVTLIVTFLKMMD
jgi:hypothetical protein